MRSSRIGGVKRQPHTSRLQRSGSREFSSVSASFFFQQMWEETAATMPKRWRRWPSAPRTSPWSVAMPPAHLRAAQQITPPRRFSFRARRRSAPPAGRGGARAGGARRGHARRGSSSCSRFGARARARCRCHGAICSSGAVRFGEATEPAQASLVKRESCAAGEVPAFLPLQAPCEPNRGPGR